MLLTEGFLGWDGWPEGWVDRWVVYAYEAYEAKKKGEKLRCLLLRRKKKIIILYITL